MHQRRTASVIRFLSSEGVKPFKIHRRVNVQYTDACLSLQQVYEWTRKFMNGISSVTDSPRPDTRAAALSAKRIFFSRGIHALPKRWNTCMKGNGDYIEK
jgi:predicted nuclease with RNAse H fold